MGGDGQRVFRLRFRVCMFSMCKQDCHFRFWHGVCWLAVSVSVSSFCVASNADTAITYSVWFFPSYAIVVDLSASEFIF